MIWKAELQICQEIQLGINLNDEAKKANWQCKNVKSKTFYAKSRVFAVSHYSKPAAKKVIKRPRRNWVHSENIVVAVHSHTHTPMEWLYAIIDWKEWKRGLVIVFRVRDSNKFQSVAKVPGESGDQWRPKGANGGGAKLCTGKLITLCLWPFHALGQYYLETIPNRRKQIISHNPLCLSSATNPCRGGQWVEIIALLATSTLSKWGVEDFGDHQGENSKDHLARVFWDNSRDILRGAFLWWRSIVVLCCTALQINMLR